MCGEVKMKETERAVAIVMGMIAGAFLTIIILMCENMIVFP